ncbi:MAG: mechanosensitive ion channel [Acidobacteriota bacterium]|nr:mechanosensitive ion channel [Acidobacteriota bacterium]
MRKRLNTVPAAILAVLLLVCLVAFFVTRNAGTGSATAPKSVANDQALTHDMGLLDTADRLIALAETKDEKNQAGEAQHLADHDLDQAFATALREAEAYRVPDGALHALAARIDQLKSQIAAEQDQVAQLTKKATAIAADQVDLLRAQLALDQDELEDSQQDLARQGGDPHAALERALQQHEATQHQTAQTAQGAGPRPTATLLEQVRAWSVLGSVDRQVLAAQQEAAAQWSALTDQHSQLEKQFASPQSDAAANSADKIARLHRLSDQRKTLAELDQRSQDCRQLTGVYQAWSRILALRRGEVVHSLLGSFAEILAVILAALLANSAIRRLFQETGRKRLHPVRVMAAVAVQLLAVLLIVLVLFGPPSQISTIIGLATAGLTVVLRDFIVSFFGWFTLMGKNGIRVGDWVEINGVSGEVIELGLLKTVLLELGNWTDTGHPTGRQVAFSNSFAMEGHYFNFSTSGQWLWDELEVGLPATGDPYLMAQEIRKLVESETETDSEQAAQDWERVQSRYGVSSFSAKPAVNLRPTVNGLEVVVRYITRAPQRYAVRSKLFQVIVDLLHKPAADGAAAVSSPVAP